jgi:hypothetical protein
MRNLRSDVEDLFAEFSSTDDARYQAAFDDQQRRALYAQAYDAERAKEIRVDPALRAKRKASHALYEKKRWLKTKADRVALEAHRAKRRSAHDRLKRDPARHAVAKAKQVKHSERHAQKRRANHREAA